MTLTRRNLLTVLALAPSFGAASQEIKLPAPRGSSQGQGLQNAMLTPARARAMASRAADAISRMAEAYAAGKKQLVVMERGLEHGRYEIERLKKEKDDTLADLRAGRFCSECGRSKTQIEATKVNFYDHVRDVGGRVEPAKPEVIAATERQYDAAIAKEFRDQDVRRKNYDAQGRRQGDYQHQMEEGKALWGSAAHFQKWLVDVQQSNLEARMQRERKVAQTNLDRVSRELRAITGDTNDDKAKRAGLEGEAQRWKSIIAANNKEEARRYETYLEHMKQARDGAVADMQRMREAFSAPGWSVPNMPSFAVSAQGELGRLSFVSAPNSIGYKCQLGKVLSLPLDVVFVRDDEAPEVTAFFAAFDRAKANSDQIGDLNAGTPNPATGASPGDAKAQGGPSDYYRKPNKWDIP